MNYRKNKFSDIDYSNPYNFLSEWATVNFFNKSDREKNSLQNNNLIFSIFFVFFKINSKKQKLTVLLLFFILKIHSI